jgi:hypothetical protein
MPLANFLEGGLPPIANTSESPKEQFRWLKTKQKLEVIEAYRH